MIEGVVRDNLPRVAIELPGLQGLVAVEFIVDTGFDGDLAIPSRILHFLDAQPAAWTIRALGDGTLRECRVFHLEMEWNGAPRTVEVLALEHNVLLGTILLEGWRCTVDLTEGGEVLLEPPD